MENQNKKSVNSELKIKTFIQFDKENPMKFAEPVLNKEGDVIEDEIKDENDIVSKKLRIKTETVREGLPIGWVFEGFESKLQSALFTCQTDQIPIKVMGGKASHMVFCGGFWGGKI